MTLQENYKTQKETLPAGVILFFKIGDFYEVFGDDAKTVAKILEIAVTRRGDSLMAGFPYHMLEKSLSTLTEAGHRVAIAEIVDNPQPGEIAHRTITEIR